MASTKNTLWCFGDSFTYGHSLLNRVGDDYYLNYPEKRVKRGLYTQLVADKFNLKITNTSEPGSSNNMIIEQIIENLHLFKKGDRAIVGLTDPNRIETWKYHTDGTPARHPLNHYAGYTNNWIWQGFLKPQIIATRRFITEIVYPHAAYDLTYKEKLVAKLLNSSPFTHYYVWGPNQWKNYQTIEQCTNGELKDRHFSCTGQQQLADDIITKWKTRKKYVCKETI